MKAITNLRPVGPKPSGGLGAPLFCSALRLIEMISSSLTLQILPVLLLPRRGRKGSVRARRQVRATRVRFATVVLRRSGARLEAAVSADPEAPSHRSLSHETRNPVRHNSA